MIYPRLTALLTAASLAITGCDTEQTPEIQSNLSKTLKVEPGDKITIIGKNTIISGNDTITLGNGTTLQNNNDSINNTETEVNKDIYTPLSENNYNFTKGEFLERLLTVLAIFTIGGTTYLLGDYNNKANKMLKGNKSQLYGHIIGILSNSKLKDEIIKIYQELKTKIKEFQNLETDKTDTNYTKKYNEIKSLINELMEILEYINCAPNEIIDKTEKLVKRYSKFKKVDNEYFGELNRYRNRLQSLNDCINQQKIKLKITKPLDKVIEDIKTRKIKSETYKELFNLAEEYNSTETSKTKMQTLCDYLSKIEKTINPLFTLPQELAQEPTNSETE